MPRNGVGVYSLPANSFNPASTGAVIQSSAWNTTATDLAAALTQSLSKDGQTVPTGNIQMGSFKIINLADGASASDAMAYGQGAKLSGNNTFVGNNIFTGSTTFNGAVVLSGSVSGLNVSGPASFSGSTSFSETVTITKAGVGLVINSTAAGTVQQLVSTDAGATVGPSVDLYRNSATPVFDDKLGQVKFSGNNASGSVTEYASINGRIVDTTAGSEDGQIEFDTNISGSVGTRFRLWGGIYANGLSEQGPGTINATAYYKNNAPVGLLTQIRTFAHGSYVAVSSTMTVGSTLPAITEGAELLVASVTPNSATSTFIFTYTGQFSNSTTVNAGVGLFMVGSTSMLGGTPFGSNTADYPKTVTFQHTRVNTSASTQTFTIRAGPSSGVLYVNGIGSGALQLYNGANKGVLRVEEIM